MRPARVVNRDWRGPPARRASVSRAADRARRAPSENDCFVSQAAGALSLTRQTASWKIEVILGRPEKNDAETALSTVSYTRRKQGIKHGYGKLTRALSFGSPGRSTLERLVNVRVIYRLGECEIRHLWVPNQNEKSTLFSIPNKQETREHYFSHFRRTFNRPAARVLRASSAPSACLSRADD